MSKTKTSLSSYYATDKKLETEGKWFEVENGAEFLLRRMGGKNQKKLNEIRSKHFMSKIKEIRDNSLPEEEQESLFIKVFVEACMIDWKNVFDQDGNDVPFDPELAEEVLTDCPDLFDELIDFTNSRNEFKKREELGNS